MDSNIDVPNTPIFYALKINGSLMPSRFSDRLLAEQSKLNLPPEQQAVTVVTPVTENGNELLLG